MKLSTQAFAQLKITMFLVQQHETSLQALKNHLNNLIKEDTGVDVSKGSWELDQDTGELTPQTQMETDIV